MKYQCLIYVSAILIKAIFFSSDIVRQLSSNSKVVMNLKDLSNELTKVPNLPHEYEDLKAKQFCSFNSIV